MIIVRVVGGLGNQMFQYALYKYFEKQGIEAKLDINEYKEKEMHNGYELDTVFKLNTKIATEEEVKKLANIRFDLTSKIKRKIFGMKDTYFLEEEFKYIPEIKKIENGYLNGFWQSEKYFKELRKDLLEDFKFSVDYKNKEKEKSIIDDIKKSNSVSIHVRRGDYINNEEATNLHYVIRDLSYYEKAIDFIKTKIENPKFFIFSNDPQWVKENLNLENSTIIDFNSGKDSYKDMYYMSLCKNNIIANSSFSWWGAWLNNNKEKIVISPNKWFNSKEAPDVICKDWIKIDV